MKKIFYFILISMLTSKVFAKDVIVTIKPGTDYNKQRAPQIAVWISDSEGKKVTTLYVTQRAAKKNWIGFPKNGRPESLPVWYSVSGMNSSESRQKKSDSNCLDVISSATPKGGLVFSASFDFEENVEYYIYVELNKSFDYNDYFTKKNSGVNGQPSIIYGAKLDAHSQKENLMLLGTGSTDGSDGKIHHDENKLTSAKNIADTISVETK